MTEKDVQLAADADAAANVIERQGWHQGAMQDEETGAVCAAGAVRLGVGLDEACGTPRWRSLADRFDAVLEAFREHIGNPYIGSWNDAPERTADDVIGALRDVATKHRPDAMTETHP